MIQKLNTQYTIRHLGHYRIGIMQLIITDNIFLAFRLSISLQYADAGTQRKICK